MKTTLRRRLVLLGMVGVAAVSALAFSNLGSSLVYYKTPTEVTAHRPSGRIRLGGLVAAGSVHKETGGVRFTLTDGAADVSVLHQGDPPGVFQEGQGALVEGTLDAGGVFHSDTLIVKHSNEYKGPDGKPYRPPAPGGLGGVPRDIDGLGGVPRDIGGLGGVPRDIDGLGGVPRDIGGLGGVPMTADLGHVAVLCGFVLCLASIITLARGLVGRRTRLLRASRFLAPALALCALGAIVCMEVALVGHDFSVLYVAKNGSRSTPLLYTVASLWGALEGSILLWALVLSGYLVLVVRSFRRRLSDPMVGWATLILFVVAAFFFGLMLGPANPFRHVIGAIPTDGPGPNPLLQNNPLMAFHPPMLYMGYVGFSVPFAFALASLITGRLGEGWLVETRRWTLVAWGLLGTGIILGAWWSYEVLGWGGFWAWDPVENAAFLPWLCGTAYLHSVMVQERRGMLRIWNLSLLVATFCLTILGTFLTRSGVLESVHSFTESAVGPALLAFFAVAAGVSVALIGWRADRLRSPGKMESPVSREGFFLLNNLLFGGFAFVVLLGTVFPLLLEGFTGQRLAVGRPYFDRMAVPVGIALLFIMAVAPALPWRRASGEVLHHRLTGPAWVATAALGLAVALGARSLFPLLAFWLGAFASSVALRQLWRSVARFGPAGLVGRTAGGMVVHLGVVLIAVALAASGSYGRAAEFTLHPGQSAHLLGHSVTYLGMESSATPAKKVLRARVRVDGGRVYAPALTEFSFGSRTVGTPSVRTGLSGDVYLTLISGGNRPDEPAGIRVNVQPLVMWLWVGGAVMAFGTLLAAWPRRRRRLPEMAPFVAAGERPLAGVR